MSSGGNSLVYIPEIGRPYQQGSFPTFLGGLNNARSDELIDMDELSEGENYTPDPESAGALIKREGLSQVSTQQTPAVIGIYEGLHGIWGSLPTDIIASDGTSQSLTLTSATKVDWSSITNYDIQVNGAEEKKYNGSVWSDLGGSPPNFKFIEVYNRFLFGAGHDKGKVRWSDPQDPETWSATHEWNLTPDSDDDITGLRRFRDVLIVFTEKGFFHLRGYHELAITITYRGEPGCTANNSIVSTPYGLFWWSEDGIYFSPDGFQTFNISELKIPYTIATMNKAKFDHIHGLWNPLRQRIEFYGFDSGSSTQDMAVFYYPRIGVKNVGGVQVGSFWVQKGLGVEMASSGLVTVTGERVVYLGASGANGYIYKQTGSDDDGTVVTALLETQRNSTEFGSTSVKRLKNLIPVFELVGTADVTYGIYIDNSNSIDQTWPIALTLTSGFILGTSLLGTGAFGQQDSAIEVELGWSEKFRKLKHRLYDEDSNRVKVRAIKTEGYLVNV